MKKLACLLLIALPVCSLAATYTVDDDGPADYNTIQAAVIDANDGDRIIVYPGTYFEYISINGKAVALRSTDPNDPNVVATTIIDGNGLSRCINCLSFNGPNAVISGFMIQNGNAPYGAGLQLLDSSPAVIHCTFINNNAGDIGGAIRCIGNATIENCTFIENSADAGGAMYCAECNPTIIDCDFIENSSFGSGGAIYCSEADPNVSRCNFNGNLARNGGGIGCFYGSSPIITDCNFFTNEANQGWGGGLDCDAYGSNTTLTNCTFIGNFAAQGGGGLCCFEGSSSIITNCTFTSNSAAHYGGGAYLYYDSIHTLENCDFTENSADFGGAIFCDDVSATIAQCSFTKNSAASKDGGAVFCQESSPVVVNCTFSGNLAYNGGGMSCINTSSARITNSTFIGNSASQHGGGISCGYNCGPTLTNCILWANTASDGNEIALRFDSTMHLNYCDIKGGRSAIYDDGTSTVNWGLGNFDVDPCFVDPGYWDPNGTTEDANDDFWVDGDYHLRSEGWRWDSIRQRWDWDDVTSRCIDAGNPGSLLDNEPLTIPQDPNNLWGHNLRINMGAYGGTAEASIPPYNWALLSDVTNDGTTNFADFTYLADMFMQTDDELFADFNRDGKVDLHDLSLLIADWLHITTWH